MKSILTLLAIAGFSMTNVSAADGASGPAKPMKLKSDQTTQVKPGAAKDNTSSVISHFIDLHLFQIDKLVTPLAVKPTDGKSLETLLSSLNGDWKISTITIQPAHQNFFTVNLFRLPTSAGDPSIVSISGISGIEDHLVEKAMDHKTATLTYQNGSVTMKIEGAPAYEVIHHDAIKQVTALLKPGQTVSMSDVKLKP